MAGYWGFARVNDLRGVWSWYLLSATLSTVGLGDVAPTLSSTRALAIFIIPAGLIIMSYGVSANGANRALW